VIVPDEFLSEAYAVFSFFAPSSTRVEALATFVWALSALSRAAGEPHSVWIGDQGPILALFMLHPVPHRDPRLLGKIQILFREAAVLSPSVTCK